MMFSKIMHEYNEDNVDVFDTFAQQGVGNNMVGCYLRGYSVKHSL